MAFREEVKCLASRWELGDRKVAETTVHFLNPPLTETQSQQVRTISETSSTWLTLFMLLWRFPEALCPTQLKGPPKLLTVAFPYEWLVLAHAPQLPKFSQISNSLSFPNLVKEIDMHVQETQRVPNKMDAKRPTPRHIVIKMPKVKDKERLLKAAREKKLVTYSGIPIRLLADFSKEILQARRDFKGLYKVMKSKDLQPKLLYPAKLSFRMKGQIKSFPEKEKLKAFITTKPLIYEILKGLY